MLVVVRHGQTAVNAAGRLQGRADAPLTELGRRQSAALARAIRPAAVVSSPLRRAAETAEHFGVPVTFDERWIELDYGELDGVAIAAVPPGTWETWRADPSWVPPGGESLVACGERVREACAALAEQAMVEDVVVVTHVSPAKAAVAWALGVGDAVAWRMFLGVASVCRIRVGETGPTLVSFNDTAHLAGLAEPGGLPG